MEHAALGEHRPRHRVPALGGAPEPLLRLREPPVLFDQAIANIIVMLCLPLSRDINGAAITIDGGTSA